MGMPSVEYEAEFNRMKAENKELKLYLKFIRDFIGLELPPKTKEKYEKSIDGLLSPDNPNKEPE